MKRIVKLTGAEKAYRRILDGKFGNEVEFIANCILCDYDKPASRLKNLLVVLEKGIEVRCGNGMEYVVVDGVHKLISEAF